MKTRLLLSLAALVALTATFAIATDDKALEGVKCILQVKKDVNPEKTTKWKEGKVYFCCDICLGKFEKMSKEEKAKVAAKANSQLVSSKQYAQEVCPFTGRALNAETKIKVNGAEVAFCCVNCKGKAEKMEGEEQLEKVFGEEAFKKGNFKPVKAEVK